jgi:hypothetical protein
MPPDALAGPAKAGEAEGDRLFAVVAIYDDGENPVAAETDTVRVGTLEEAHRLAAEMVAEAERKRPDGGGFWHGSITAGRWRDGDAEPVWEPDPEFSEVIVLG